MILVIALVASLSNPHKFTCEQVRSFVAEHGKLRAIALAVAHGATWAEIKQAKKCLK